MVSKKTSIGIALPVLIVLALGGWWTKTHSAKAKETTNRFYNMWTDSSIHPLIERSYRGSPYLTREFQRRLDRLGRKYTDGGFDPVVCGVRMPDSYSIRFKEADMTTPVLVATMKTGSDSVDATITMMKQENGTWLIDDIACPPAPLDRAKAEEAVKAQINQLSKTKAVVGGKFQVTGIVWNNDGTATVSYEDGHIALKGIATFVMEDGKPVITEFKELAE